MTLLLGPSNIQKITDPFVDFFQDIWPRIYQASLQTGTVLTTTGMLFLIASRFKRRRRPLEDEEIIFFVLIGTFVFYAVPMWLLVDPQFRYQSAGALFLVLAGFLSGHIIVEHCIRAIRGGALTLPGRSRRDEDGV